MPTASSKRAFGWPSPAGPLIVEALDEICRAMTHPRHSPRWPHQPQNPCRGIPSGRRRAFHRHRPHASGRCRWNPGGRPLRADRTLAHRSLRQSTHGVARRLGLQPLFPQTLPDHPLRGNGVHASHHRRSGGRRSGQEGRDRHGRRPKRHPLLIELHSGLTMTRSSSSRLALTLYLAVTNLVAPLVGLLPPAVFALHPETKKDPFPKTGLPALSRQPAIPRSNRSGCMPCRSANCSRASPSSESSARACHPGPWFSRSQRLPPANSPPKSWPPRLTGSFTSPMICCSPCAGACAKFVRPSSSSSRRTSGQGFSPTCAAARSPVSW